MGYKVLARKWRPRDFASVIGQDLVVQALTNSLEDNRLHHAYLFVGTRGVGKTTLARLLAKALNCEQGISSKPCNQCGVCVAVDAGFFADLIEIDAASKTGVDDTRNLLENAQYAPTVGRYKVYLIDEVHMFSKASFNALLKTLEEPPERVKFLLATTDPQKLPATILSRCLQLRLQHVDTEVIVTFIATILKREKCEYEDKETLYQIAEAANGSVRDALSLLDQALVLGRGVVRRDDTRAMLGYVPDQAMQELLLAITAGDTEAAIRSMRDMLIYNGDCRALVDRLVERIHQLTLLKHLGEAAGPLMRTSDPTAMSDIAHRLSLEEWQLMYSILIKGYQELYQAPTEKMAFEMLVLRLIAFRPEGSDDGRQSLPTPPQNQEKQKNQALVAANAKHRGPTSDGEVVAAREKKRPPDPGTSAATAKQPPDPLAPDRPAPDTRSSRPPAEGEVAPISGKKTAPDTEAAQRQPVPPAMAGSFSADVSPGNQPSDPLAPDRPAPDARSSRPPAEGEVAPISGKKTAPDTEAAQRQPVPPAMAGSFSADVSPGNQPSDTEREQTRTEGINAENWTAWLDQKRGNFGTIVWQYLRNSSFQSLDGNTLRLNLKREYLSRGSDTQRAQVAKSLSQALQMKDLTLEFKAADFLEDSFDEQQKGKALKTMEEDEAFQHFRQHYKLKLERIQLNE